MAKTKKELQDQVPEEEQAVADTGLIESESVPQTDLERLPPALTDLELEATNTLDPDAPQSDLDLGGPMDDQIPAPETRSEAGEPPSDLTQPDAEPVLQTGLEMDQELDQLPGEPTRPELEPAQEPEMPSETEPVPTEDTDDAQPPKRRRRNTRKKAEETEADAETETETPSEEEQSDGSASKYFLYIYVLSAKASILMGEVPGTRLSVAGGRFYMADGIVCDLYDASYTVADAELAATEVLTASLSARSLVTETNCLYLISVNSGEKTKHFLVKYGLNGTGSSYTQL